MVLNRTKMPKSYSIDLREKLFAQLYSGMSTTKESKKYSGPIDKQYTTGLVSRKKQVN